MSMTIGKLANAIVFSMPLVAALVCFCVTALDVVRTTHPVRRRIRLQAMTAYGMFALCWFLLVSHLVFPSFYMLSLPVFVPAVMLADVLLFRIIRTSTDPGNGLSFPTLHFALPAFMFVVMTTLWLAVPLERIAAIIQTAPASSPGAYIITGICFAYTVVYPAMALVRISRFRRRKAQNPHDRVLARLFWAMLIEMIVAPVPIFGRILGFEIFTNGGTVWLVVMWLIAVWPSRIIYVISCFNLLSDNYMVLEAEKTNIRANIPPFSKLGRERVEHYIETKKPWLNPAFRITDMAEDLYSNRAYISAFINSEYGMNFSRFVNSFRLEEVERLREEAKRKKQRVSMLQLILNAGFSSYRSYLRAKAAASSGSGESEE